jgi:hypothetical protein
VHLFSFNTYGNFIFMVDGAATCGNFIVMVAARPGATHTCAKRPKRSLRGRTAGELFRCRIDTCLKVRQTSEAKTDSRFLVDYLHTDRRQ